MKEKIFTSLVIILSVSLVLKSAEAHQPVLNSEESSSEEKPYIIEVNTVPGFSEKSIVPQMLKCANINISDFITQQIESI